MDFLRTKKIRGLEKRKELYFYRVSEIMARKQIVKKHESLI